MTDSTQNQTQIQTQTQTESPSKNAVTLSIKFEVDTLCTLIEEFVTSDQIFNHFDGCILNVIEFAKTVFPRERFQLGSFKTDTQKELKEFLLGFITHVILTEKITANFIKELFEVCFEKDTQTFNRFISKGIYKKALEFPKDNGKLLIDWDDGFVNCLNARSSFQDILNKRCVESLYGDIEFIFEMVGDEYHLKKYFVDNFSKQKIEFLLIRYASDDSKVKAILRYPSEKNYVIIASNGMKYAKCITKENVNQQSLNGSYFIHYAVQNSNYKLFQHCLSLGANMLDSDSNLLKGCEGKTIFDFVSK